jgi:hypothetical protein
MSILEPKTDPSESVENWNHSLASKLLVAGQIPFTHTNNFSLSEVYDPKAISFSEQSH